MNTCRTAKQCRERWNLHLRRDLKRGAWDEAEDLKLIDLHRKWGNRKYSLMAKALGRTDVHVRNRIHSTQRMVERHLEGCQTNTVRKNGVLFKYFVDVCRDIDTEKDTDVKNMLKSSIPPLETEDDVMMEELSMRTMDQKIIIPLPPMMPTPPQNVVDVLKSDSDEEWQPINNVDFLSGVHYLSAVPLRGRCSGFVKDEEIALTNFTVEPQLINGEMC